MLVRLLSNFLMLLCHFYHLVKVCHFSSTKHELHLTHIFSGILSFIKHIICIL